MAFPASPLSLRTRFEKLAMDDHFKVFTAARKGIKTATFYAFAGSIKMSEKKLAGILNISPRTISNYKEKRKSLEPVEGEHLLKLIALYAKGEEIFGNIDEFNYWMEKPFWKFSEKPIDWLTTPGGTDLVMDELNRLTQSYAV